MNKSLLCITLLLLVIFVSLSIMITTMHCEAAASSGNSKKNTNSKKQKSASKTEVEIPAEEKNANKKSASTTNSKEEKVVAETQKTKKTDDVPAEQQQAAAPSKKTSSSVITIRGSLSNVTRMVRDPKTSQVVRYHPKGAARISVNGGEHVFFSDVSGNFAIIVPTAPQGSFANNAKAHNKVNLYQIDVDWEKLVFPRSMIEVDEFGNFRGYQDGSGKIIGSKGRIGLDVGATTTSNKKKSNKNNFQQEDSDDDNNIEEQIEEFFNSNNGGANDNNNNNLIIIDAVGEVDYFVPRQQFRIFDLLKNPMIIMMIVTAGMVYVMPQLVDQDEMKKQMREMQSIAKDGGGAATSETETKKVK